MNDYAGTDHRVIYDMVKAGQSGSLNGYAATLNGIRNVLGGHVLGLRERLADLGSVWSDGAGSDRMATDLGAVIDYLDLLAAGLSGQPSAVADLVSQGAADLTAAQPPAVLPPPPPPGLDLGSLHSDQHQSMRAVAANPLAEPGLVQNIQASYDVKIHQAEAARQLAGETATALDGQYRTLLARLTPPPEPPPMVSDAASTSPIAPAAGSGSDSGGALTGGSAGRGGFSAAGAATGAGFGSIAAASIRPAPADLFSTAVPTAIGVAGAAGSGSIGSAPAGSVNDGWLGDAGVGVGVGVDASGVLGARPGGPGAAGGVGGPGGPDAVGGFGGLGGLDGWAGSAPASGLRADPAALTGEWNRTGSTDGSVGPAQLAGTGAVGHLILPGGVEFDPSSGAPVVAGAGQVGSVTGGGVSPLDVAGVGGLAALAGGALYLARGSATALGGSGAIGVGGVGGVGGMGGVGGVGGGGGAGSLAPGSALTGNGTVGTTGAAGSAGSAAGANSSVAAGRALLPGTGGSNSMVQGGQIGQAGRAAPGSAGYGSSRPAAPGASIGGGQQDSRVTWLVEDRDLYGIGPSVAAVIEVPIEPA